MQLLTADKFSSVTAYYSMCTKMVIFINNQQLDGKIEGVERRRHRRCVSRLENSQRVSPRSDDGNSRLATIASRNQHAWCSRMKPAHCAPLSSYSENMQQERLFTLLAPDAKLNQHQETHPDPSLRGQTWASVCVGLDSSD